VTSVTVRAEWDMGHRLPNHEGPCRRLHGHRYAAELTIKGKVNRLAGAADEGMVVDFTRAKDALRSVVAEIDHRLLLHRDDMLAAAMRTMPGVTLVGFVPTAENIADEVLHAVRLLLLDWLQKNECEVTRLRLWETPTSYVEVTP